MTQTQTQITFTPDQQAIIDAVQHAVDTDDAKMFLLHGYAGTGKSFTTSHIINNVLSDPSTRITIGTPTAAAARVLRDKVADALTDDPYGQSVWQKRARLRVKTIASLAKHNSNELDICARHLKKHFSLNYDGVLAFNAFMHETDLPLTADGFFEVEHALTGQVIKLDDIDTQLQRMPRSSIGSIYFQYKAFLEALYACGVPWQQYFDEYKLSEPNEKASALRAPQEIADRIVLVHDLGNVDAYSVDAASDPTINLFIIDETSMCDEDEVKALYDAVVKIRKTNLLLVGDPAQIKPFDAEMSPLFAGLDDGTIDPRVDCYVELTDVKRATGDNGADITDEAHHIREGKSHRDRPYTIDATRYSTSEAISLYTQLFPLRHDNFIMLAKSNAIVDKANIAARHVLGYPSDRVVVGDKLAVTSNFYNSNKDSEFVNSDLLIVDAIGEGAHPRLQDFIAHARHISEHEHRDLATLENDAVSLSAMFRDDAEDGTERTEQEIAEARREHERRREETMSALLVRMIDAGIIVPVRVRTYAGKVEEIRYALMWADPLAAKNSHLRSTTQRCVVRYVNKETDIRFVEAKYGYCITVHKAQGGEWDQVVYISTAAQVKMLDVDRDEFGAALYTAMTRAKQHFNWVHVRTPPPKKKKRY